MLHLENSKMPGDFNKVVHLNLLHPFHFQPDFYQLQNYFMHQFKRKTFQYGRKYNPTICCA